MFSLLWFIDNVWIVVTPFALPVILSQLVKCDLADSRKFSVWLSIAVDWRGRAHCVVKTLVTINESSRYDGERFLHSVFDLKSKSILAQVH